MKSWVIVLASVAGLGLLAEDAFAQRSRGGASSSHRSHSSGSHHQHHHNYNHYHHGWYGAGIVFAPAYWPYYAYAPAPVYVAPPVYVESGAAPSTNDGYWYFCPDSRAFYPYVKECRSGWQAMVPGSPPPN